MLVETLLNHSKSEAIHEVLTVRLNEKLAPGLSDAKKEVPKYLLRPGIERCSSGCSRRIRSPAWQPDTRR